MVANAADAPLPVAEAGVQPPTAMPTVSAKAKAGRVRAARCLMSTHVRLAPPACPEPPRRGGVQQRVRGCATTKAMKLTPAPSGAVTERDRGRRAYPDLC